MKLTLACIARNEESALSGMIESVAGCADEIVVLDTGSVDKTVEVAKRYTENVFIQEWDDSFANARNACLEHCTGDWILWLDGDEKLAPGAAEQLKPMLEKLPPAIDLVLLPIQMQQDDGGSFQRFPAERLMRGNTEWRWCGDMHNYLNVPTTPDKRGIADHIEIVHNRSCHSPEQRAERAAQRLHMAVTKLAAKAELDPKDRRSIFYVAGTYHDAGQHEKALEWFARYFPVSDFEEERYQAAYLAGQSCLALGRTKEAKEWFNKGATENWRRAETDIGLAELALAGNDLDKAEYHYKCASLKTMPMDPMFVEYEKHTWIPHAGLFDVAVRKCQWDVAVTVGQRALGAGASSLFAARYARFVKDHTKYGDRKIAVLVDRGQMDFIQPVIDEWIRLGKEVAVATEVSDIDKTLAWNPDIIWCEWGGELAVELTKRKPDCRIIVRLHGYEVYSGLVQSVDWLGVDAVICVSQHLLRDFLQRCPLADVACRLHVVHGGVPNNWTHVEFCQSRPATDGRQIAMLGYVNDRKNIPLALQILAECPKHTLHIAGEWQSDELRLYVEHMARELGVTDRLKIYGRVEDKWEFLADKDFILSTSTRETFHYALAEGMMCDLKPIVHNWPGADEFYPRECIFNTAKEAAKMLQAVRTCDDLVQWRTYAEEHLGEHQMLRRIKRIVDMPIVAVVGHASNPDACEYRLCEALERLGCRTDGEALDAVIVKSAANTPPISVGDLPNCKRVFWQDDVLLGDHDHNRNALAHADALIPHVDLVACQSPAMVDFVKARGAKESAFLPVMGGVHPFRKLSGVTKDHEVGFFGWVSEYREPALEKLKEDLPLHVFRSPNHAELNEQINRCKIMLNIHAWSEPNVECRICESMSAGACVVTEKLPEGHPFPPDVLIETDDIVGTCKALLKDTKRCEQIAERAYRWVWRDYSIDSNCERILEEIGL